MPKKFIVGFPTADTKSILTNTMVSPPVVVTTHPTLFLAVDPTGSLPADGTQVSMRVNGRAFALNSNLGSAEFDLTFDQSGVPRGLDIGAFVPYARLSFDPMRSKTSKWWCSSVADSLYDQTLDFTLKTVSEETSPDMFHILATNFNPDVKSAMDNIHS